VTVFVTSIGSTGHFRRTHRQSRRILTTASQATPQSREKDVNAVVTATFAVSR